MSTKILNAGHTKARLLEAAEALFVEHGFEAMSLRQITTLAGTNLAAVNYHFGGKEGLMQALLRARLDRLNQERLRLLAACERQYGDAGLDASAVLSALFVPALRMSRASEDGSGFVRLLGRVYSDPSPFVRNYLREHYQPIFGRFFEAFARALPQVSRNELGMRLHLCLKALSGLLAGEKLDELIASLCMGEKVSDALMLARLISLLSPTLTAPFGDDEQIAQVERVVLLADAAAAAADAQAANAGKPAGVLPPWAVETVEA
ncbi:TetR/AcrR family transcriptional regulator [Lysobacter enzymogenes]|uniref:TetR family transcriptional regulator n=1 Tax=Lysobacter enzymogenes TaxID=69 RepID=A0AAU9AG40_LYSEN|nr:TetR family transcriptional regulator [Lysobacter enzymogenes]BAV97746.1 TetR family transcriptional regulator [Lysobacter enzymogenes]